MVLKFINSFVFVLAVLTTNARTPSQFFISEDTICENNYHESGELSSVGCYTETNDARQKVGLWVFYDMYGHVKDSIYYKNDKPYGERRTYYPSGKLNQVTKYNEKNAEITYYHRDGSGYTGSYLINDDEFTANGWVIHFYSNSIISDSVLYIDNEIIRSKSFDKNGVLKSTEVFSDNHQSLERCYYKKNGDLKKSERFVKYENVDGDEVWKSTNKKKSIIIVILATGAIGLAFVALM